MTRVGGLDVSRETLDRLEAFSRLVAKWNPKINLVSKSDVGALWERHIVDSAQVFQQAGNGKRWVDLGSGGGFPGIVVAVLSAQDHPDREFVLVESDQRKAVFLRTAARELDLKITVLSQRIEQVEPLNADILTARALADLSLLLSFAERHLARSGTALFLKGARWKEEHTHAQRHWSYSCEVIKSTTNAAAAVLKIQDIARV